MTYRDIQNQPWSQILAEAEWKWPPPVTVHLPIQPAHSPDFVHVDSALFGPTLIALIEGLPPIAECCGSGLGAASRQEHHGRLLDVGVGAIQIVDQSVDGARR